MITGALILIKNLTTGESYRTVTAAAAILTVSIKDIRMHLSGKIRRIRGQRLICIETKKPRKRRRRDDLRKPIICIETKREYVSVTSAAKQFKVSVSDLSKHLRGHRGDVKGFTFEYLDKSKPVYMNDLFQ